MKETAMTNKPFKHAPCDEPLNVSSTDPKPDDVVTCPKCGLTVRYEAFHAEIQEYLAEKVSERMSSVFRDAANSIKSMTFHEGVRPKKVHRFVVDLNI